MYLIYFININKVYYLYTRNFQNYNSFTPYKYTLYTILVCILNKCKLLIFE